MKKSCCSALSAQAEKKSGVSVLLSSQHTHFPHFNLSSLSLITQICCTSFSPFLVSTLTHHELYTLFTPFPSAHVYFGLLNHHTFSLQISSFKCFLVLSHSIIQHQVSSSSFLCSEETPNTSLTVSFTTSWPMTPLCTLQSRSGSSICIRYNLPMRV